MHIHKRFLVVLALVAAIVPMGGATFLLADVRGDTAQKLQDALDSAQTSYRQGITLDAMQARNQVILKDAQAHLLELGKKKREIRLQLATLFHTYVSMQKRTIDAMRASEATVASVETQKEQLTTFAQVLYGAHVRAQTGPEEGRALLRLLRGATATLPDDIRTDAVLAAQQSLTQQMMMAHEAADLSQRQLSAAVGDLSQTIVQVETQHEDLLTEYAKTQRVIDRVTQSLTLSDAQLREVQRETAEVQRQVLRMQGDLSAIDGRIRAKAERELVQKGLMKDGPQRFVSRVAEGRNQFAWPADGPVSAGFHDTAYEAYFHVPHQGMDIVVPQGSPVRSAADGIVFLARDGGAKGFSYILIGHRDGYATLYGHLSAFAVKTGDEVTQGQLIGFSGGTPGTHGAGPMTTAAHLHFEVMLNGVHINPRDVLP